MPTLTLTDMETRIVLAGLAELPLKVSLPVVKTVEAQLIEQSKPPESEKAQE